MATKKTTGSKTAAGKKSTPLDPEVADKLLDLLSTDNSFRRLFKKDPQAALAKVGYKPSNEELAAAGRGGPPFKPPAPPKSVPPTECLKVDRIAPKEQIVRSRGVLRELLTSGLTMQPIQLNVSTTTSRRTRK
ncbi:MAG: NHLP-related RiPP peptide [Proteobacteria bacterium]|nr:NHLP-related RiPP peptide [Pseudomonadota bacterium]